jgi:hypothetical protein
VLHQRTVHSRRSLAFMLWPESSESQARTNLRKLLYTLRHVLPDEIACGRTTSRSFLVARHPGGGRRHAQANTERARGRAGGPGRTALAASGPLALYDGDLLPSCYDDWILSVRGGCTSRPGGSEPQPRRRRRDAAPPCSCARPAPRRSARRGAYRRLMHLHVERRSSRRPAHLSACAAASGRAQVEPVSPRGGYTAHRRHGGRGRGGPRAGLLAGGTPSARRRRGRPVRLPSSGAPANPPSSWPPGAAPSRPPQLVAWRRGRTGQDPPVGRAPPLGRPAGIRAASPARGRGGPTRRCRLAARRSPSPWTSCGSRTRVPPRDSGRRPGVPDPLPCTTTISATGCSGLARAVLGNHRHPPHPRRRSPMRR